MRCINVAPGWRAHALHHVVRSTQQDRAEDVDDKVGQCCVAVHTVTITGVGNTEPVLPRQDRSIDEDSNVDEEDGRRRPEYEHSARSPSLMLSALISELYSEVLARAIVVTAVKVLGE